MSENQNPIQSQKKSSSGKKIVVRVVGIAGVFIFASSGAASAFDLPGPLKNVWNATVGKVSSTFTNITNEYFGSLIDEYLPKGMNKIFGELGLPDPAGMFADIRDKAKSDEDVNFVPGDSDLALATVAGEMQIGSFGGEIAEALGTGFFSHFAQKRRAEAGQALGQTVEGSQEAANASLKSTKTQEIQKLQSQQLAQLTAGVANLSQHITDGNGQLAGLALAASANAKNSTVERKREYHETQNEIARIAGDSAFQNGILEKK